LIVALQDSLSRVRGEHREIHREIELQNPRYADLAGITKPLTLREVQQNVLSGAVLVEYAVRNSSLMCWVVTQDSVHFRGTPLDRDSLRAMVTELRQPFLDFREGKIYLLTTLPYNLELAHKLYTLLIQPIEVYLKEYGQIIIVPDGILHTLPFGSLVTEIVEREVDPQTAFSQYEKATYLIEKYAISYAPSVSVLNPNLKKPPTDDEVEGELLAFGNPDFGRAPREKEETRGLESSLFTFLLRSGEEWVFEQLPMAEEEVIEISKVFGGSEPKVFIGEGAKEEIFKEEAPGYRHIHIATHGVFEDKEPLYSRIVFALDDDPKEDGFLEAHEIFNLMLNADLVVLSACETGLGELCAGEGLIGLTRAFMYAGAPSIVASLWSVDESTCRLMKEFYQNLKEGMTKSEALRQAKITLIHTREGGMSYAHPFLWAPFVLVGEWR
jgi:CHAT domain-containing protein